MAELQLNVDKMLDEAISKRASDLHLQVGERPDIRVDGSLKALDPNYPVLTHDMIEKLLMPLLTDSQREEFLGRWELDFSYSTPVGRFRVNYHYQQGEIGAAFRHIPNKIPNLAEIQAPYAMLDFARLERGLVIVTGPTGSGKSTTLAAMLDIINVERASHILTLEDPIEFVHTRKRSLIKQREIGRDSKSFAEGLRRALRQDPDVILVGEMRDPETTSIAITAAETGHLVLSTMHTRSAPSTVDRIIDQFPPGQQGQIRTQLASSLAGVVSQTLIPRADGEGRVAAHEVLIVTSAIENIIRKGNSEQLRTPLQTQADIGMQTMDKALVYLVQQGYVDLEVARRRSQELHEFDQLVEAYRQGSPVQIPRFVTAPDLRPASSRREVQMASPRPLAAVDPGDGTCPIHHVPLTNPLLFDEATGSRYPAGTTHHFCIGRSALEEPSAARIAQMRLVGSEAPTLPDERLEGSMPMWPAAPAAAAPTTPEEAAEAPRFMRSPDEEGTADAVPRVDRDEDEPEPVSMRPKPQ